MSNAAEDKQKNKIDNETGNGHVSTDQSESTDKTAVPSEYHYEDNKCLYTDPVSKQVFEWQEDEKKWVPKEGLQKMPDENYQVEDGTYVYVDNKTGVKYKWDKDGKAWKEVTKQESSNASGEGTQENVSKKGVELRADEGQSDEEEEDEDGNIITKKPVKRQDMSKGVYGFENNTHTFTDASDGTVYLWDKEKNAWFPKLDEDFLAQYQMSYGFVQPNESENKEEVKEKEEVETKKVEDKSQESLKKKQPQPPSWFEVDPEFNNKVYVTNLPLDITEAEFVDLMQKYGLVMKDLETGKMKVKLYTEPGTNVLKGDALCTYIKVESVELALKILDGYEYKGKKLSVERAKFTMKGEAYDPSLKPKKRRKKDKEKLKKIQEKLFAWHPDKLRGERSKNERVVIVKNLFDPSIFDKDVALLLEYQQDLREECSKCGDVRKVTIYDRHPDGVAQIMFREAEAADACVQLLNNRWFGKRRITAETWDGKTKYKIVETEEEVKKRLQKWDSFLEKSEKGGEEKTVEEKAHDSDQDTRSSAGSDDLTDDEQKKEEA